MFPCLSQKLPSAGGCACWLTYEHFFCLSLHHSCKVTPRPYSNITLFYFHILVSQVLWNAPSVWSFCPASVYFLVSHQRRQGRGKNCPYTTFVHVLLSFCWDPLHGNRWMVLCHILPFPKYTFMLNVYPVESDENFYVKTFVLFRNILFENVSPFEGNNNFVHFHIPINVVKSCLCIIHLTFSACHNLHSCQFNFCCLLSVRICLIS